MSPEAQRIAIAGACGDFARLKRQCGIPENQGGAWERDFLDRALPDYLSDLNAMHEAEKAVGLIVGPAEWDRYCMELRVKIGRDIEIQGGPGSVAGLMCLETAVSATAAQRAEAFLKTLGKWTP